MSADAARDDHRRPGGAPTRTGSSPSEDVLAEQAQHAAPEAVAGVILRTEGWAAPAGAVRAARSVELAQWFPLAGLEPDSPLALTA